VAWFRLIPLLILLVSGSSQFEEHLKLGQYYLEQKASGRAVTEFEEAVRLEPNRADATYNLGIALRQWGDLPGAEAALRRACHLQPHFPEAHFALGLVFGDRIGSEKLGLAEFQTALAQKPDYPEGHFNVGVIYWKENALDQATESFRKAVAARPDSAQFRTRLGQAWTKKERFAEAIQELTKAVELDPASQEAYYQLAVAQARSGNAKASVKTMETVQRLLDQGGKSLQHDQSYLLYSEGRTALDRGQVSVAILKLSAALSKPHDEILVRTALGVAYQMDGNLSVAAEQFKRTTEANPKSLDAHLNLGVVHMRMGHAAQAIRQFETVLAFDPNFAEAHYNLGLAMASQKRWEIAADFFRKTLQLNPSHAKAYLNLARVLRDSGDRERALVFYRSAWQRDKTLSEAALEYGRQLSEQRKAFEAIEVWKEGLGRNPIHLELHRSLLKALEASGKGAEAAAERRKFKLLTQGSSSTSPSDYQFAIQSLNLADYETAVAHFRNILEKAPEITEVRRDMALALFAKGDYAAACAEYRKILNQTPDDGEIRLNLGVTLLKMKQHDQAREELEAARNLNPLSAQARYQLGTLHLAMNSGQAMQYFHEARRLDPGLTPPK